MEPRRLNLRRSKDIDRAGTPNAHRSGRRRRIRFAPGQAGLPHLRRVKSAAGCRTVRNS